MKLAVVTDSTAYLPERIKNHEDLFIIPIPVILDGKVYNEGIDIEADEYYALLKNSMSLRSCKSCSSRARWRLCCSAA